jgi:NADPH-dependent glutamate synthase beta subunit-like oxidoreductase/dihydroorotate dehydrogenase
MLNDLYLPVNVAGIEFKNPFYVASGPTTNSVKQLKRIEETGWAGASIKLTIDPAPYINRVPRYALFKDRNALAFTAEKRLTFEEGLRLVDDAKKVLNDLILFANITYAGEEGVDGWVNMAKKFEEVGADIIELNMCCPNMSFNVELSGGASGKRTGASLGQNGDAVSEIVRAIKKEIKIPLFVKLTPEGGRIAQVAKALYEAGADAVGGTSNRLAIPPINLKDPKKAVYHLQDEISMSCYCGPWLKPLALRDTYEIRKANGPVPRIMMAGGVRNYIDAAEMIMCGADLIGICSETLYSGFGFIGGLIRDLKNYMKENGYNSVREMRDLIVSEVRSAPELTLYDGHAELINPDLAAPCKAACPNSVPAQAYVRMVSERRFREAYDLIMSKSPLQSVCGIVCNKECEAACTRKETGEAVRIREIKRFVIEYAKAQGWTSEFDIKENNKKVAVVGAGPSGLSCAWNLRKAGYDVTVFEREKECGGMLRYGIPTFRFDKSILDEEIEIMKAIGIKFVTGKALGKDFTVDSLKKDGFDAIYLAVGTWKGRKAGIPGEDAEGVIDALQFMRKINDGERPQIGDTVVVIGGGFTAADAARSAKRLGANQVYIAYRRTRDQMPITDEELFETEEEGVKIMYLVSPEEITVKDGKVTGIKMNTNVLGDVDDTGRRCPIGVEDCSDFTLRCDTVIMALGQQNDGSMPAGVKADKETLATNIEGVYAGGDILGAGTVIRAIAMGRKAAAEIDKKLSGDAATVEFKDKLESVDKYQVLERSGYKRLINRFDIYARTAIERVADFEMFTRTLTEEEAVKEASKCLRCGCGEGCMLRKEMTYTGSEKRTNKSSRIFRIIRM